MISPAKFLGLLLPISLAFELSASALSVESILQNDHIAVDGGMIGLSEDELPWGMDSDATIRILWVFCQGGDNELVLRYARRDPLGEGYPVYGEDGVELEAPVTSEKQARALTNLDDYSLFLLKLSDKKTTLEARLFLNRNMLYPPMSLGGIWGDKQENSPWRTAISLDAVSQ